jgi:hypothetical protein
MVDEVDKHVHHVHLPGTNGSTDAENHDGVNVIAFPLQLKGEVRLLEPHPNLACWITCNLSFTSRSNSSHDLRRQPFRIQV